MMEIFRPLRLGLDYEWGGAQFPLNFFDTEVRRECDGEFNDCMWRGGIVCDAYGIAVYIEGGGVKTAGKILGNCTKEVSQYLDAAAGILSKQACLAMYLEACSTQKSWCDDFNSRHGL